MPQAWATQAIHSVAIFKTNPSPCPTSRQLQLRMGAWTRRRAARRSARADAQGQTRARWRQFRRKKESIKLAHALVQSGPNGPEGRRQALAKASKGHNRPLAWPGRREHPQTHAARGSADSGLATPLSLPEPRPCGSAARMVDRRLCDPGFRSGVPWCIQLYRACDTAASLRIDISDGAPAARELVHRQHHPKAPTGSPDPAFSQYPHAALRHIHDQIMLTPRYGDLKTIFIKRRRQKSWNHAARKP